MVSYGDAKTAMFAVIKQVGSHVSKDVKSHLVRRGMSLSVLIFSERRLFVSS